LLKKTLSSYLWINLLLGRKKFYKRKRHRKNLRNSAKEYHLKCGQATLGLNRNGNIVDGHFLCGEKCQTLPSEPPINKIIVPWLSSP